MKKKYIAAKEFDEKFEAGEDLSEYLDINQAHRPQLERRRVNVSLPAWMLDQIDNQAKKMGVTRQSILKVWIAEKLKEKSS